MFSPIYTVVTWKNHEGIHSFNHLVGGWTNPFETYALVQRPASIKAFHCFGQQYTQELCNKITSQNVLCQQVDVKEYVFLCNNMCFFNQLMQQICQFDYIWFVVMSHLYCNLPLKWYD